jgi:hypothetical protein
VSYRQDSFELAGNTCELLTGQIGVSREHVCTTERTDAVVTALMAH